MAEVLHAPSQRDAQSYYHASAVRRTTPSSATPPSARLHDSSSFPSSPRTPPCSDTQQNERTFTQALDYSGVVSSTTNPTSTHLDVPIPTWRSDLEHSPEIDLPSYDDARLTDSVDGSSPPASPMAYDESCSTDTTRSDSPLYTPSVVDDTAVKEEPSRQVDFLSHEWREEDIWASWRHIVSQRKSLYGERSRLENASWRSWAKTKFDLRTVSPERLNWLKESDVTWLYGPLKSANSYPVSQGVSEPRSQMSKNNSFINKKPILKKRSVSEAMLQKSLSTSSLVKQAADRVQAQSRQQRRLSVNEIVDSKLQSETPSRDQIEYFGSQSTSTCETPCEPHERRHIRFDERVEQCIAVDCKDPVADVEEDSEDSQSETEHDSSETSSDDGVVMMKRKKPPSSCKRRHADGSRAGSTNGRKIIETLPATTLKYRTDSPDIAEPARHHTFGRSWNTATLSPSPSQETLRPAQSSNSALCAEDEDAEDVESDSSWSFGANNPKSSLGAATAVSHRRDGSNLGRSRSSATTSSDWEAEGMRRTSSGMLMPYDEYEDEIVAAGLFGRVSETINTARDIAHVIWNVGWRSG